MHRFRILCFLIAAAAAEEAACNADSDGTCQSADQTALLQGRIQLKTEQEPDEKPQEYRYGPYPTATSALTYFKGWAQGAVDSRLANVITQDVASLETNTETMSAAAASGLFQAAAMQVCPEKAILLQGKTNFELVQAQSTGGVHHVVLKGKGGSLQYMASHLLSTGKHRMLVADPPVCSGVASLLEATQGPGSFSAAPTASQGAPALLKNDDHMVEDCKTLFTRTVKENCHKDVTIAVTSATVAVIDGFAVHMIAQVCNPTTKVCKAHRPECDFEEGKWAAAAVESPDGKDGQLPEEKLGLQATLRLGVPVCDADVKNGVSQLEADEDSLLMRYAQGENSVYKGFEHVYENIPVYSALEVGELPASVDFREKYRVCFPALGLKKGLVMERYYGNGTETVRYQGSCGSCWAFAAATTTMTNMCISSRGAYSKHNLNDRTEISVQKIISCEKPNGNDQKGCDGGNMVDFDLSARKYGLTMESDSPYKCSKGSALDHFTQKNDCDKFPWNGDCSVGAANPEWWWAGVVQISGENPMMTYLAGGHSLYGIIVTTKSFMKFKGHGVFSGNDEVIGGHAVNILGYGVLDDTKYWLLQNSWGASSSWGHQGFGKFKRGVNLAGIENIAIVPRTWITCSTGNCTTGGKAAAPIACHDSLAGSGLVVPDNAGNERAVPCSEVESLCDGKQFPDVPARCPVTCDTCGVGFNGGGSSKGPAPAPPPPPPWKKVCDDYCKRDKVLKSVADAASAAAAATKKAAEQAAEAAKKAAAKAKAAVDKAAAAAKEKAIKAKAAVDKAAAAAKQKALDLAIAVEKAASDARKNRAAAAKRAREIAAAAAKKAAAAAKNAADYAASMWRRRRTGSRRRRGWR